MADRGFITEENAQILMTKWWSAEEMMRHGKHLFRPLNHVTCCTHASGVPCREGPFTETEKDQVESAITRYKAVG